MLKIQKYFNYLLTDKSKKRYEIFQENKIHQFDDKGSIEKRQLNKLNTLIAYAYKNIPYYTKLFNSAGIDSHNTSLNKLHEIECIPFLTKSIIQNEYDSLHIKDLSTRGAYTNSTGGSTGEPVSFIQDTVFFENSQASFLLALSWRNANPYDSVIKIWGAERDTFEGKKPLISYIKDFFRNRIVLNCFIMTEKNIVDYINIINRHKPKLIIAYVQSIYEIAKYAEEHNINIETQCAIHTGAGTLYECMRLTIEKVFGCKVFNHYGTREMSSIASECKDHSGLHITMDHTLVEVVDENGIACPPGVEGEIVVTTLNNFSMPLIRYKIGDIGTMSSSSTCSCGCNYPKLEKITGRTNGVFKTKKGDRVGGEFFTHIFINRRWVKSYQVIQKDFNLIKISIVKGVLVKDQSKDIIEIKNKIKKIMGMDCVVEFDFVERIPKTKTGKLLNTICEI
jgi:phenylacetate-CoA ligase